MPNKILDEDFEKKIKELEETKTKSNTEWNDNNKKEL